MAICKNCGKKGLFLKLNSRGLCSECADLMKATPSSGTMIISSNGVNEGNANKAVGHSDEESACNYLIDELVKAGFERDKFRIEHRAKDYTSLFYALEDIARIKITDNVKWITIPLCREDRNNPDISSLFEEKTLSLGHCKSYFDSTDDLATYVKFLSALTPVEHYGTSRELTDSEKEALDYTFDYMISLGANPDCFYLYILTQEAELIYKSWHCTVRYKLYKKKKGGKITYRTITNSQNSDTFVELSDIKKHEEDIIKTIQYANSDKFSYDMSDYIKYNYPLSK